MATKPCAKHKASPVVGYSPCPGCEVESLREDVKKAKQQRDELLEALLNVARMAEALKKPCGMNPESPQAIRNGEYMNISYAARAAIAKSGG